MTDRKLDGVVATGASESAMITLSTIQTHAAWTSAQRLGVLRADGRRVFNGWRPAYRWMRGQMARRLRAFRGGYPIWAWYLAEPELSDEALLPTGQSGVCLEFRAPSSEVLLSNFDAWHSVLNNWYLALDEAEEQAWFERCPDGVLPHRRSAACQAEVERSWERIFDLDLLASSPSRATSSPMIQAVVQEVPLKSVVSVRYFQAV